ncbi:hypothetical protein Asp14428_68670 [Actinoplanes sp. NBRC 14428]|nr:hypothetical protein Asp14428_68670 [Actinoplanes sp. NBRC 14428]
MSRLRSRPATVCALVAAMVATGAAVALGAGPAAAAEADQWGYAMVDGRSVAAGTTFTPSAARRDSSTHGDIRATKRGVGDTVVRFAGLATPTLGVAHVSPVVNASAGIVRDCRIGGPYGRDGADVVVPVQCTDLQGNPADAAFSVAYTVATGTLTPNPGAYAYLVADQPASASYRPAISATTGTGVEAGRTGVGLTRITLSGADFLSDGGSMQITAYQDAARCAMVAWQRSPGGAQSIQITVKCVDVNRNPVDARFTFTFMRGRSVLGTAAGTFGYLNTDRATNSPDSFNSSGALNRVYQYPSTDDVQFPFPSGGGGPFLVLTTAQGTPGTVCGSDDWSFPAGPPSNVNGRTFCANSTSIMTPVFVAVVATQAPPLDPDVDDRSNLRLDLVGLYSKAFNPVNKVVRYELFGEEFYRDPAFTRLTVNGTAVPAGKMAVNPTDVQFTGALVDGRNVLEFDSMDYHGRPLHLSRTVWAGSYTLHTTVLEASGAPYQGFVEVTLTTVDDQSVSATVTSTNGVVDLPDVPATTVNVSARALSGAYRVGAAGTMGNAGSVTVVLQDMGTPSTVANNDFSQGYAGWDVSKAPVALVNHVEGNYQPAAVKAMSGAAKMGGVTAKAAPAGKRSGSPPMKPAPVSPTSGKTSKAAAAGDVDLAVFTYGQGERSVVRTFRTTPGTTDVRVRYRFITTEVPYGWYGSQFNDYFRVLARSQSSQGLVGETNSMNGLGLFAFDYATGATGWRDVRLPVNPNGDVVQVYAGVANVADPYYDSAVVVDIVQEAVGQVTPRLSWNPNSGGLDLRYAVDYGKLTQNARIDVYWARGTGYENRIGNAVHSVTVPAGTDVGTYTQNIPGSRLDGDPDGETHLIAVVSPTRVDAIADVALDLSAVARHPNDTGLVDAIKDGMRVAGQAGATVTSALRTPQDQARVMFNNLTNTSRTLAQNIQAQKNIYGAAGDAVIDVFASQTASMTTVQQAIAARATIEAAMLAKINELGCRNVSTHCGDPATTTVFDVAAANFGTNAQRFIDAVTPRVTRFLDERSSNRCFHFELTN